MSGGDISGKGWCNKKVKRLITRVGWGGACDPQHSSGGPCWGSFFTPAYMSQLFLNCSLPLRRGGAGTPSQLPSALRGSAAGWVGAAGWAAPAVRARPRQREPGQRARPARLGGHGSRSIGVGHCSGPHGLSWTAAGERIGLRRCRRPVRSLPRGSEPGGGRARLCAEGLPPDGL